MNSLFKIQTPSVQLTHADHFLPLEALHCRDKVQQTAACALHCLIATNEQIQRSLQTAKQEGHKQATIHLVNNEVRICFAHSCLQHNTTDTTHIVQRVHTLYNDCISHCCERPAAQNQDKSHSCLPTEQILQMERTLQTLLTTIQQNDPQRITAIESTLKVLLANIEALRLSQTEHVQASVDILEEAIEGTYELLTARERIQQLEAEKEQLSGRIDALLERSSAQDQLSDSQQSTISSLQQQVNLHTQALEQASESIKKQSSIILEAKTALHSLNQTIDKKNQENTHLAKTLTEKETDLLAETQKSGRLSSELQQQKRAIERLKNNVATLTASLKEQKTTSHTLASQLKEAGSSLNAVTEQMDRVQIHAKALETALATTGEELSESLQDHQILARQLKDRETTIATLTPALETAATTIENLESAHADALRHLRAVSEQAFSLEEKCIELHQTLIEKEEELAKASQPPQILHDHKNTITTLTSALEKAAATIENLESVHAEALADLRAVTQQAFSLEEQCTLLRKTLDSKEDSLLEASQENTRLSELLSEYQATISELEKQKSSLQNDCETLLQLGRATEEEVVALEGKTAAQSAALEQQKVLVAQTNLQLAEREARLALYHDREEMFTVAQFSEKERVLKELADKQAAIELLQNKMDQLIEATETKQKALNNQISSLTLTLEQAAASNTTLQEEKSRLSEALETEKKELEKSLEAQSHLHNNLNELQEALLQLQEQNVSLRNDYETLVSSSKVEREALLLQLDEMTERADMVMNESSLPFETSIDFLSDLLLEQRRVLEGLRSHAASAEKRIRELEVCEINETEYRGRNYLLTSDLNDRLHEISKLQEELTDLRTTNNKLVETKKTDESQQAKLRQQLSRHAETISQRNLRIKNLSGEVHFLKGNLAQVSTTLREQESTVTNLSERLETILKELNSQQKTNEMSKIELNESAEKLRSLTEQLNQLNAINSDLTEQLNRERSAFLENHRKTTNDALRKNQTNTKQLLLEIENLSQKLAIYSLQEHDVALSSTSNQSSQYPELALPVTPAPQEESSDTVPPASSSEESNIDRITRSADPLNDAIDEALGRLSASPALRQSIPPSQRPNPTQMKKVLENLKLLKNVLDFSIGKIDSTPLPLLSSAWEQQAIKEIETAVKTQGRSHLKPIQIADALLAETGHFPEKEIGRANLESRIREKLSMLEHPHFINRFIEESSIIAFTKKTLECYHRLLSLIDPQEKLISQALSKLQTDSTQQGIDPRSEEALKKQVKVYYDQLEALQNEHRQLLLKKQKTKEDTVRLRDLTTKLRNPKTPPDISLSERALSKFETKKKTEKEKEQLSTLAKKYETRSKKLQALIDSLIKSLEQEIPAANS